jgi:hypothetical protein
MNREPVEWPIVVFMVIVLAGLLVGVWLSP